MYNIDTTCSDECFLFHVMTWKHILCQFIFSQSFGETAMLLHYLKQMFWKKSTFIPVISKIIYAANTKGLQQNFYF